MATVLVVDDARELLSALGEALTEEGWEVVAAASAREALEAVRSRPVDVVLCDVLLGAEDGRSLRHAFAGEPRLSEIPFVFMTASTREVRSSGLEYALPKPFSITDVLGILERARRDRGQDTAAARPVDPQA
jgi:CheY-like chemotaxis protein